MPEGCVFGMVFGEDHRGQCGYENGRELHLSLVSFDGEGTLVVLCNVIEISSDEDDRN
jgi:hypothetical protein